MQPTRSHNSFRYWLLGCVLLGLSGCAYSDVEAWQQYKDRFLSSEGRVIDSGNGSGSVSHSEGQGWGMILAVTFNDRETFDHLWRWTRATLTRNDTLLFSWRYNPADTPPVSDPNNATDGDLFIAWALALAAERWQDRNYGVASVAIRNEIANKLVREVSGYTVLLPGAYGFVGDDFVDLNLSYWFMPALRDFATMDPAGPWQQLVDGGRRLLEDARFGPLRLPVDWIRLYDNGIAEPAPVFPPRFGFDAVRIPLYFAWAGFSTDPALQGIAEFWRTGAGSPAWIDVENGETAAYPVSRGVVAIQRLLAGGRPLVTEGNLRSENYYSASLLLLSQLARADYVIVPVP
jgi:endoglucanase